MTIDELLAARAARREALRSAPLLTQLAALSFPTLPDLGTAAAPELEDALASLHAVELWLWPSAPRYATPDLLPYVYAAAGDRHPRKDFRVQARRRQISQVAAEVFDILLAAPDPLTAAQLRDIMGAARTSALTIEHGLHDLAQSLKVLRLGRTPAGDPLWRPLLLALPHIPKSVDTIAQVQAAAALITHYLDTALCATEDDLAVHFSPLFSRARIHEAVAALATAHALDPDYLDGRPALRLPQRMT